MGQAKARGSREERVAAAVEAAKTHPKKQKLNKTQQRALAFQYVLEALPTILGSKS